MFLIGLLFWSYIKGLQPDIHGLEKFMDFGFVNAALRTRFMPPTDMWFAGEHINYYYFGQYICAFLTKLSNIDSAITYNLMLATIFSFTLSLSFSIGSNMVYLFRKEKIKTAIIAGLISALLVTMGGNLHTVIYAGVLPAAQKMGLYHGEIKTYYYPEATRYIGYNPETKDKTIHEFPIYSFVVSDLHGHVSNIPYVLTMLAIMLSIARFGAEKKKVFLIAFFLATSYMTNTWDYPIYFTVLFFTIVYTGTREIAQKRKSKLYITAQYTLLLLEVVLLSQLLLLPFTLSFYNFSYGIGLVMARTPIYQLLVLWGYQLVLCTIFAAFLMNDRPRRLKGTCRRGILDFQPSDIFTVILAISAAGLVLMPEVVYVRDIYGTEYHRANTMFKLTYQSFIMFGLAAGYIVTRVTGSMGKIGYKAITAALFGLIIAMPMIYPFHAIKGYYGSLKTSNYKGLYGLKFMEDTMADDYEAVKWLNENVKGQAVVLEANGDSYTDYQRISMATGLPTIQGWFVHEWLWRGGSEFPQERADIVAKVYESDDVENTKRLLNKYNVKYIVIGKQERDKFKNIKEQKLTGLGTIVFDSPETIVIRLRI